MITAKLLKQLVEMYSPSGKEKKLAEFILRFCKENAIPAKLINKNIVIHYKGEDSSKCIIFNAHMDTIKANSFDIKNSKGKLHGLGASDNKGAIVSLLKLAKEVQKPKIDVWVTFVCNEETDGSGTQNFLKFFKNTNHFKHYKSKFAVVCEPTNLASIEIGHRGNAFVKLSMKGISGHSAITYKKNDLAISKMIQIISQVEKEFEKWKAKYKDSVLGEPSFNITSIGSDNKSPNKIPGECFLHLDIRTTPQLHNELINLLTKTFDKDIDISFLKKSIEPANILPDREVVKRVKKLFPTLDIVTSLGSTDQIFFIQDKIDAIVFGPGEKDVIHTQHEYIQISQIEKATNMYKKIIDRSG